MWGPVSESGGLCITPTVKLSAPCGITWNYRRHKIKKVMLYIHKSYKTLYFWSFSSHFRADIEKKKMTRGTKESFINTEITLYKDM
ncbi:hypothetical protein GDO86_010643 [Hymenochirus boettgeri]|uniref:Uncharacterized protein n=1 Tax=Hymenochirus boettgeri TaxID=247094 RepID=A0A8T2JTU3_9PIPI|nr:hypothetical protein GDO86_010643 [Hymenochirus boettgeri]